MKTEQEKREYRAKHYLKNKEQYNRKAAAWYKKNKKKHLKTARDWYTANLDKIKKKRLELKRMCMDHYSKDGGCVCCGTKELSFLSLDHIKDNATEDKNRRGVWHIVYRTIVKEDFPEGFQTLCFNCQWGKRINGGFCPHHPKKDLRKTCKPH